MGIVKRWLDKYRRAIDVQELWPVCKKIAKDDEVARATFYYHIIHDKAWTAYFSDKELRKFVSEL
jgi:hypothetical protein